MEARTLPEPLPPAERTVGQLVAETIRLYGRRFWAALALGVAPALLMIGLAETPAAYRLVLGTTLGGAVATAVFIGAVVVAHGRPERRRAYAVAFAVGLAVFAPAPLLSQFLLLPALAWLAALGLAVPAALVEGKGFAGSLARGLELARAGYAHALGSLATLVLVGLLTSFVLFFLLRGQADTALEAAGFLTVGVIAPLVFLGTALLYEDQRARWEQARAKPAAAARRRR